MDWFAGPANGGTGTAGKDLWYDGESLLVITKTKADSHMHKVSVDADGEGLTFRNENGDELDVYPEAIWFWAKVTEETFPSNVSV